MCHRLHEPQPRKHGEKQNTNILEMLWCKFLCRNFSRSDPSIQKEFIFWPHRNKEIRGKIDIHKSQKSYGVYFWAANSLDLIHQFRRNLFFGRTATKKSGEKLIYTNPKKSYGVYFWAAISWDFARQFISNMDPQNCTVLRNLGASFSRERRLSTETGYTCIGVIYTYVKETVFLRQIQSLYYSCGSYRRR